MTRRRFWVLIHRVNGLALAGFLTVVGATGSVLAWKAPLERFFAPRLFVVTDAGTRADPLWIRKRVAAAYPWSRVDMVDLSRGRGAPLLFPLTAKPGSDSDSSDDEAYADPFTGNILGSRRYGDLRQGARNIVPFVYQLHQELALGSFGTTCLGVAALVWTVDCFVGMYLSLPAPLWRRGRPWFSRFRPSLQVRWQPKGFRRLYDLHRASGVWLWLMLLLFAWTGVAFNLPVVYESVMHLPGGSRRAAVEKIAEPAREELDWQQQLRTARAMMALEARTRHFQILSERFLSYERNTQEFTYRVRSTLDVDPIGNTQLRWLHAHPAGAAFSAPTGSAAADTFTTWLEAIHEAQVGGGAVRALVCLTGVATVFLSVTGVLVFARKMRR